MSTPHDARPTADDLRCTVLGDFGYMQEQGHAAYPEVFFNGQIDPYEMAKALREVGRDPLISMPPGVRYLVCTAGFIFAKLSGWRVPDPKLLKLEPQKQEAGPCHDARKEGEPHE